MTWVKIDDGMIDHPKIIGVSDRALRLYLFGLCYSARHLTDGFVPAKLAHQYGKRYAAELVEADLWDVFAECYEIHDYHDYQPTREKVLEVRGVRTKAGKLGGRPPKDKQPKSKTESKMVSKTKPTTVSQCKTPDPYPTPLDTDLVRSVSQAVEKPRPRNEQWDGLAAVFGYSASGGEATLWGKLVKQLADFGATKSSIEECGRRYLIDMPTVTCTPTALVRHYQRLMAAPIARVNGRQSPAEATLELARQARMKEHHAGQ
jgi:hypothetical protein